MNKKKLSTAHGLSIEKHPFGVTTCGDPVDIYGLCNSHGNAVRVTNYGATIVSALVPDQEGKLGDVVLGYETLSEYENNEGYLGAIVGRYANRIAKSRFVLDGAPCELTKNEGEHHLHGGKTGLNSRVWSAEPRFEEDRVVLDLTTRLADGEDGYPGNLDVRVTISFTNSNELVIEFGAVADKTTVVNLTHHGYFNLSAFDSENCLDHQLRIDGSRYTPVDSELIPTGGLESVAGTPFDFRRGKTIGQDIRSGVDSLIPYGGYDHNWVLDKKDKALSVAAEVMDPVSGRKMTVETTQPGLQFYTGQYLKNKTSKKEGSYDAYAGFCLETQHFPDSPNQENFPSVCLQKGDFYSEKVVYRFDLI